MRPMKNINSYILQVRDSYDSRHEPYEKHSSRNN